MKREILLVLMVFCLSGCGMLKFPTLNAPRPPDTTYQYEETFEKNPTAVVMGNKVVVVEQQKRTVTAGFVHQEKQLSSWQKFCNWLAGWSLITIAVVGGCLAFGITGPAVFLWNRYQTFRKTTKQMVRAIHEEKAIEKNPALGNKLSAMLDKDSKKLIDDLKME